MILLKLQVNYTIKLLAEKLVFQHKCKTDKTIFSNDSDKPELIFDILIFVVFNYLSKPK